MTDVTHDDWEIIEKLTDSFVARLRLGQRPSIEEYVNRHPELAEQLRGVLPAVVLLERHAVSCIRPVVHSEDEARPSAVPREIGDYTIIREVGRGGMGIVYEAIQQSLGRHVALKVLSLSVLPNTKHLARFQFEARAAAGLQHPHIVPVYEVGELNGVHYYAMQFICGQSLNDVLTSLRQDDQRTTSAIVGHLNGDDNLAATISAEPTSTVLGSPNHGRDFYRSVARIGLQVAEALAYAHSKGVLHRDIKPSNLLIDAKGAAWVADFGLAKTEGSEGLTETGDFVGTLRYMAPERLEGVLDRRSDLYSLGATLYELITLQAFFETENQVRLIDHILRSVPPSPSKVRRSVPRDLETIILKAIAKDPAARYRTADEMADDLRRFLTDRPVLSRRPSAREQLVRWCRRNPLVATLSSTVIALLISAAIMMTWSYTLIRSEIDAKDHALVSARDTIHQLLARVAGEKLNNVPMSHPLRVELLQDALKAYEGLVALGDSDFRVYQEMADVLQSIAGLQRELNQYKEAAAALQRSASLYAALAAIDPHPPTIRESLGIVESDLAYTWQCDDHSPNFHSFPIESQYRQSLATFESIQHEWPKRRQPVTLALRYLADICYRRGDLAQADKLWRESISQGKAYLQQWPANDQVRSDLCWSCSEYYEAILSKSPDRAKEATETLSLGVANAEIMLRHVPGSMQAIDVLASLHFRQALACCHNSTIDDAIPLFQRSISEIETACESVPWDTDYWNTIQWFQKDYLQKLHDANRTDEINTFVRQTADWLKKLRAKLSGNASLQRELTTAQTKFITSLRTIGCHQQADEFNISAN